MATGVLPICFGEATKFAQNGLEADKSYHARARLGVTTETGDVEGAVVETHRVPAISEERIKETLAGFLGEIQQVPSMYSALKYQGKPLYEYARQGITIERESRPVSIFSLALIEFTGEELAFSVRCSKGTYIRTLAEDIGKRLGVGAHLIELRRTAVDTFHLAQTITLDDLFRQVDGREIDEKYVYLDKHLLPVDALVEKLPKIFLNLEQTQSLLHGQKVRIAEDFAEGDQYRLFSVQDNRFLGIGVAQKQQGCFIAPFRLIASD